MNILFGQYFSFVRHFAVFGPNGIPPYRYCFYPKFSLEPYWVAKKNCFIIQLQKCFKHFIRPATERSLTGREKKFQSL